MINKNLIYRLCLFCFAVTGLHSCANMASPSGGDPDVEPPKVVRMSPVQGATNVSTRKMEIIFDENVNVLNPSEKVIIAPPQKQNPVIMGVNRKVSITLRDTLIPNTTYTIDFTDAIVDMNENNPLDNFSLSFSTGDVVDSLGMSGKVLMANNLEPMKGIYVGLHSNQSDTAFTKVRFDRISRTNDKGEFTIRGVAPGEYKLYALDDPAKDFMYKNPASTIAFLDSVIVPYPERSVRHDTLRSVVKEIVKIDTIIEVNYTKLLPDNITLRAFSPDFQREYLQKHERQPNKLIYYFGAKTVLPQIELLGGDATEDWYVLERNLTNDSLTYWIKDQNLIKTDTLTVKTAYLQTDTLNRSVWKTDTLKFFDRTRKKKEKKKEIVEDEEELMKFLEIQTNISSTWDTFRDIIIEFEEPITTDLAEVVKLVQMKDSVETAIDFNVVQDSLNPRKYFVKHEWAYGGEYLFSMDSATVYGLYGLFNKGMKTNMKVKAKDQYGSIKMMIEGIPEGTRAFVELLNGTDQPVRRSLVKNNLFMFADLPPGKYYARVILDENNNGKWDTGNYYTGTQPEIVCYYSNAFDVRAKWSIELDDAWVIDMTDFAKQKPLIITKNKPVARKTKIQMLEEKARQKDQAAQAQQRGTSSQAQGLSGVQGLR